MTTNDLISLINKLPNPYSTDFFDAELNDIIKIIPDDAKRALVAFFFCNFGYEAFRMQLLYYLKYYDEYNNGNSNKSQEKRS